MLRISRLMPCVYIVCRENTDLAALIGPILLSLVNSTDVKNTDILKIRNTILCFNNSLSAQGDILLTLPWVSTFEQIKTDPHLIKLTTNATDDTSKS